MCLTLCNNRTQYRQKGRCKPLNSRTPMRVLTVAPSDTELVITDLTRYVQQIRRFILLMMCWSGRETRSRHKRMREHRFELTQVVEGDFGLSLLHQTLSDGGVYAQITQNAIADPMIGNGTQLLFHSS